MSEVEAYPRTEDEEQYRQHWELPLQIRDIVPYYMRDLVCICENTAQYKDRVINGKLIYKCRECDKYVRWVQRICKKCDVRFVLTFSHPRYVIQWPTCWACTQDESYDPFYEQAKRFPHSIIAAHYARGAFDGWPHDYDPIIPPKDSDLIHKEKVTSLDLPDIDLGSLF